MNARLMFHHYGKDKHYKIWHAPQENMIIYTYSNGGSIVFREKMYPIKRGTLCFIGKRKQHYTMPSDPEIYDRSKIFFSDEQWRRLFSASLADARLERLFGEECFIYAQIPPEEQHAIEGLFEKLNDAAEDVRYGNLVLAGCFAGLLLYLDRYSVESVSAPTVSIDRAIEFINQNIHTELKIEQICKHAHISKYHFCRQFKRVTGLTVMDYILKTRLVLSQTMLTGSTLSVGEISERCGFCSISYFCRIFKAETKQTPLQYRKQTNDISF